MKRGKKYQIRTNKTSMRIMLSGFVLGLSMILVACIITFQKNIFMVIKQRQFHVLERQRFIRIDFIDQQGKINERYSGNFDLKEQKYFQAEVAVKDNRSYGQDAWGAKRFYNFRFSSA